MLNLKPIFDTGYTVFFRSQAKPRHTIFICALAALALAAAWLLLGFSSLPLAVEVLAGILAAAYLYKQFKGVSGDLCGAIIVVGEFAALLCSALTG